MKKTTLGRALTEQLAAEQRHVVSVWRALLLLQRATQKIPSEERRWEQAPANLEATQALLSRLTRMGEFRPLKDAPYVYEALAPYARKGLVSENEVLMEAQPFSALSHATALVFHDLSDDFPQEFHLILPSNESTLLPPGVKPIEWDEQFTSIGHTPKSLFGKPIQWHQLTAGPAEIGTAEYRPNGYPVRVTTPERTLIDAIHHPEWCGGFSKALQAWIEARDTINLDTLVETVDALGVNILRQRAGFIMDELELHHPALMEWSRSAKRGGSSRLVGSEPFSSQYSEKWKLSINAPVGLLAEARA
ncbi:type IV toxin-antitoxin system AbiEi family antitoxin [Corallococcus sp. AS-1-12]|uniref:type IV toxin-antitoxin system AbiEi family antitoxin domain-containing protein n=1 Tax=Corallococcus sp. AS-1-12 TaxID=2874598 RepID=UPI001CBEE5A0|nr:type IV toxin-antitoxin system AbiEi family antitoxin [Corallococcus sp. AS-1-12]